MTTTNPCEELTMSDILAPLTFPAKCIVCAAVGFIGGMILLANLMVDVDLLDNDQPKLPDDSDV